MSNELNQEAERAAFEAAYQKEFPVSVSLMLDKFDRDEHGDYKENCVYTAYHLWQAARRASAPASEDVALPELPEMTILGTSRHGSIFRGYTAEQVEQIRREAVLAISTELDRMKANLQTAVQEAWRANSELSSLRAALSRQSSAVGMEPVYQAYAGYEGWVDIEEADIESYQSMNLPIRTLYATPADPSRSAIDTEARDERI